VRIETFEIIYELGDKVREMLADLLDPDLKEVKLRRREVRATFPARERFCGGLSRSPEGKNHAQRRPARVRRGKESLYEGKVANAQTFQGRRQRSGARPRMRHQAR